MSFQVRSGNIDELLRAALRAGIPGITPAQEDAVLSYVEQNTERPPKLEAVRCETYALKFGIKAYADCVSGPGAD
ncbi:MAG: hypothetical protein WBX25_20095 [Rhodomicrobium sp.]